MDATIDSYTVSDLMSRYGLVKSSLYSRISTLAEKGHDMASEKQGRTTFYNADQVSLMDELDDHLKAGGALANFGEPISPVSPAGHIKQSGRTQDRSSDSVPAALGMSSMIESISTNVLDTLLALQVDRPAPAPPPADPLANLRALEEACDRGWLLSTSQLAPLVGLKSVHGKVFERFGFRFVKAGKNGAEGAWRVEKL